MEEEILKKYFRDKMKQKDIANELNVSKYKVSRVVTKDARYKEEKERRKKQNKQKHSNNTKRYISKMRKSRGQDIGYSQLKQLHKQAAFELSGSRNKISNRAFRDWNPSIYQYDDKTQSYRLKKEIITSIDVPKLIKWKNS